MGCAATKTRISQPKKEDIQQPNNQCALTLVEIAGSPNRVNQQRTNARQRYLQWQEDHPIREYDMTRPYETQYNVIFNGVLFETINALDPEDYHTEELEENICVPYKDKALPKGE